MGAGHWWLFGAVVQLFNRLSSGLVALFLPLDQTGKTEIGMAAVNGAAIFGAVTLRPFLLFFHGCLDKCFLRHLQSYPHSAARFVPKSFFFPSL